MASNKKVVWQPRATKELYEILEFYNNRNGSAEYSERLASKMEYRLSLVGENFQIGEKVDEKNVRRTVVENYVIYYWITPDSVAVLSIRDARRKPKRFKWEGENHGNNGMD